MELYIALGIGIAALSGTIGYAIGRSHRLSIPIEAAITAIQTRIRHSRAAVLSPSKRAIEKQIEKQLTSL